jgi:GT2 family glycosyltransferase
MDLSVVVVTFNSAACLEACLGALSRQLPGAEVLVVDNASSDGTQAIARAAGAGVLENERNDGFGRASNRGAREAARRHVLFLNPDVVVTRCDRDALAAILEATPLGLVGPARAGSGGLIGPQREPHPHVDWLEQTIGTVVPRELPRRARSRVEGDWVSGSMLLVRRSEFDGLGGFDPRFFLYYEDRDLAARYRAANLPIRSTDAIAGAHAQGRSTHDDGLRVEPAGWAFLGWIEYVFVHRGEAAARRSARSARAALKGLAATLDAVAKVNPQQRVLRKRAQLTALLTFLQRQAAQPLDDSSFCPDARRLLAESR